MFINLSPELFPQQYTFVYIQRMPRLIVFLSHGVHSSGGRLGGTSAHGEPPLAIPLMIFMSTQGESSRGSKWTLD